jgi:hypothetical protein
VELLTTAVTTLGHGVARAFLSALWFVRVLRRLGLHVPPPSAALRPRRELNAVKLTAEHPTRMSVVRAAMDS